MFGILGNLEAPQTRSDHAAVQGNATTAPTASFLLEGNSMFRFVSRVYLLADCWNVAHKHLYKAVPWHLLLRHPFSVRRATTCSGGSRVCSYIPWSSCLCYLPGSFSPAKAAQGVSDSQHIRSQNDLMSHCLLQANDGAAVCPLASKLAAPLHLAAIVTISALASVTVEASLICHSQH